MYSIFDVGLTESTFIVSGWLSSIITVTFVFQILCRQFLIVYYRIITLKMRCHVFIDLELLFSMSILLSFSSCFLKHPCIFLLMYLSLRFYSSFLLLIFREWSFSFHFISFSLATLNMLSVSDS